jgi:AAA+ superfamily predicted ATPase
LEFGAWNVSTNGVLIERGYASSLEHLWDELQRIDRYVRAQTERWLLTIGMHKPADHWGMLDVDHAEIEAYLSLPFVPPTGPAPSLRVRIEHYWSEAEDLAKQIAVRSERTPSTTPLCLRRLRQVFGLSDLEHDILLLCLLPELDGRYRRLFGCLQDDASRDQPSIELLCEMLWPLADAATLRAAFEPSSPLLRLHLITVSPALPGTSHSTRLAGVDRSIATYLLGGEGLDSRLEGIVSEDAMADNLSLPGLEPSLCRQLQAFAAWWRPWNNGGGAAAAATVFLHGPYGSGRLDGARLICADAGMPLLVVDTEAALHSEVAFADLVDLAYREARLRGAAIIWCNCEALIEGEQQALRWDYLISATERTTGLIFLASSASWEPAGQFRNQFFLRFEFAMPSYEQRRGIWEYYLPPADTFAPPAPQRARLAELLAASFELTTGQIRDALGAAWASARSRALAGDGDPRQPLLRNDFLFDGARRQAGRRLVSFARRLEPRTDMSFEDLILPAPNRRQLDELRDRVRFRDELLGSLGFERRLSLGVGLIVLFTGSPGTGKTMAAEILAGHLHRDLYKIDLSSVVSKYVGETEKNLGRVFTEAEGSNAILFFDEADALFGKRGEVKDARDRWANIEVNFLLQRVEEYDGVVIMATNLRQNIDEAFMRRIHAIVEFPSPDVAARSQIWKRMFPPEIDRPTDLAIDDLAKRFTLPGGSIRNIVVDAAVRALAAHSTTRDGQRTLVTLKHLVLSIAREYQKLGKPLSTGEFGEQYYEWVEEEILQQPLPDAEARYQIWLAAFPPDVIRPDAGVLHQLAAEYPLHRSAIRAIVLAAVAAGRPAGGVAGESPSVVTLQQLLAGIEAQQREIGPESAAGPDSSDEETADTPQRF